MLEVQTPNDELDVGNANLFDLDQVRNYFHFVRGSLRRRRKIAIATFASIVVMAVVAVTTLPRTYHVEAKLLAQRSQVLAIRGDSPDATTAPSRGAAETVMKRDNLVGIIKETDLINHYRDHRAISQRAVDRVRGMFGPAETDQEQLDDMVDLLEKKLSVWTSDDTVSIAIDWPDAQMAARIVDIAQRNFLDARHAREITALVESIGILQGHVQGLQSDVDSAVKSLENLRGEHGATGTTATAAAGSESSGDGTAAPEKHETPAPKPAAVEEHASAPQATGPDLTELKASIDSDEKAIDEMESDRKRRLSDLQAKLTDMRATLTENHPAVVNLKQQVTALSTPSPQVAAKRAELAALQADFVSKRGERRDDSPGPALGSSVTTAPPQLPSEIMRLDSELRDDRDPTVVYARAHLRDAMEKYSALRAQIQTAQIDLETARAAFKYRYNVLTPAEVPRKPVKPKVLLILLVALFAAAVSAVTIAVIADIRAGVLVERWQLETILGSPILGEIEIPRLLRRGPG